MRSGVVVAVAAILAGVGAGCATESEQFKQNMYLGRYWFKNGRFGESADRFRAALEERPETFEAVRGLANAASEYSHELYGRAEDMLATNKRELGLKHLADADSWSQIAMKAFTKAFEMEPGRKEMKYDFALMLYKRSTSRRNVPYPAAEDVPEVYVGTPQEEKWRKGFEQRRKELDEAIRQFEIVLEGEPGNLGSIAHVRVCKAEHAHRYLGLALFLRSDWERSDGMRGRAHLHAYVTAIQAAREQILKFQAANEEAQLAKDREMKQLDVEISEVKGLIRDRLKLLQEYEGLLRVGKEYPALSPAERERRLASVAVEISAVSELVTAFEKLAPPAVGKDPARPN